MLNQEHELAPSRLKSRHEIYRLSKKVIPEMYPGRLTKGEHDKPQRLASLGATGLAHKSKTLRRWGSILCLLAICAASLVAGQVPQVQLRGQPSGGDGTWNAESFSWFYYDMDEGAGNEKLEVEVSGRHVDDGSLVYSSEIWTEEFDFEKWGHYQAVAFLGKRYLAGYLKSGFTKEVSSLEDGELRDVLIDDDAIHVLDLKTPLSLQDGYVLKVAGVATKGDEAYFILQRNEKILDDAVVKTGDTYVYRVGDDFPVIFIHISSIFLGADCNDNDCGIVNVDGVFQVRDPALIKLEVGNLLGSMMVSDLSKKRIELENHEDLNLDRDREVPLIGGLLLKIWDDPTLIYYPVGLISSYGVYDINGPVYTEESLVVVFNGDGSTGSAQARWNYNNFTGFYFDDKNQIGSESLIISKTEGRRIMPTRLDRGRLLDGLQYTAFPQPIEFEFKDWGQYTVVCLFGQLWFVGYRDETSPEIDPVNMLAHEQLGQALIDTDLVYEAYAGTAYTLKEGYQLYIRDLVKEDAEEDRAFIELFRDSVLVDSAVVKSNTTYVYERNVGDVDDLPIILVHFAKIFIEKDEKFVEIDGLFQVSDRQYLPIESGNDFGEVTVYVVDPRFIFMINTEPIDLKRDTDVTLWPGMNIAVADNDTLRYRLYTKEYVIPSPEIVSVSLPRENVTLDRPANFSMAVLAGDLNSVTAEIVNSGGKRMAMADLTEGGVGSWDQWFYFWQWDPIMVAFSDDGALLPPSQLIGGLFYLNESSGPADVAVKFDESGKIDLIQGAGNVVYYISPSEYERSSPQVSYENMLRDESLRTEYFKVEQGISKIKFYEFVDGMPALSNVNHTLWHSLTSLEPHLVKVDAPPGRYELRVRVENSMDALWATEFYFNVSETKRRSVTIRSSSVEAGEIVTVPLEIDRSENDTRIDILYDPNILELENASGCAILPDEEAGTNGTDKIDNISDINRRTSLIIPRNCSLASISFKANETEGPAKIEIVPMENGRWKVANGTILILPAKSKEVTDVPEATSFQSALASLVAFSFAFVFRGQRRRPPV